MDASSRHGDGFWGKFFGVLVILASLLVIAGAVAGNPQTASLTAVPAVRPAAASQSRSADPIGQTSQTFSGVGNHATELFRLEKGLARFEIAARGDGYFGVWLMDATGKKIALLANDAPYQSGSKAVGIERAGNYLLSVEADDGWAIVVR